MNRVFHEYAPHKGPITARRNGVLLSMQRGKAVAYALWNLEDRGPLFVDPGELVYSGMIIGEHSRGQDLEVNPLKAKQLTNMRASGKDDAVVLTPPIRMTLEKAIAYVSEDEAVEVTPQFIRLRKRELDPHMRKRASRRAEVA
jgi:GTP-binding protein